MVHHWEGHSSKSIPAFWVAPEEIRLSVFKNPEHRETKCWRHREHSQGQKIILGILGELGVRDSQETPKGSDSGLSKTKLSRNEGHVLSCTSQVLCSIYYLQDMRWCHFSFFYIKESGLCLFHDQVMEASFLSGLRASDSEAASMRPTSPWHCMWPVFPTSGVPATVQSKVMKSGKNIAEIGRDLWVF